MDQGGLAGAVGSYDGYQLGIAHLQVYPFQDADVPGVAEIHSDRLKRRHIGSFGRGRGAEAPHGLVQGCQMYWSLDVS